MVNHCRTELGTVAILSFSKKIPEGWERLTLEEGMKVIDKLKSILTQWSIIAFQFESLSGPGYGYKIGNSYGTECGQGFILKRTVTSH
jgi:hypothetical protein